MRTLRKNRSYFLLYLLIILLFLGNFAVAYGWLPGILPDALIALIIFYLFLKSLIQSTSKGQAYQLPGLFAIFCLVCVAQLSMIYNQTPVLNSVVFLGYLLQFYVLFLALLNIGFDEVGIHKINKLIFVLALLQIPISMVKYYLFGTDVFLLGGSRSFGFEVATGTFGRAGGSMGTTFPLIAIGFMLSFYFHKRNITYIYIAGLFVLFSFLTGKRAFPVLLIPYITLLLFLGKNLLEHYRIKTKTIFLVLLLGSIGTSVGVKLHPSLNPNQKVWGEFEVVFLIDKVYGYETSTSYTGTSIGRVSSTKKIISNLSENGFPNILLGMGPGTFMKSGLIQSNFRSGFAKMGLEYGFTGFVLLVAQIGFLGFICYLWLLLSFFTKVKSFYPRFTQTYHKALCFGVLGMLIVMVFDTLAYSVTSVNGKVIPGLFFIFLAQMYWVVKDTKDRGWRRY